MQISKISNCSCGSTDFLVITEKLYEGSVEDGVLKCEPDSEGIMEIQCRQCQKQYDVSSFEDIDY